MTKSWTLPVKVDPDTGDHYIELNDEILADSKFQIGDTLEWRDQGDGSWILAKKEKEMKTYLVETVSIFRHRYAIRAESLEHAYDTVVMNEAEEFANQWGEKAISAIESLPAGSVKSALESFARAMVNRKG